MYIFTDSAFMKEAANSLLKVLEEPPEFATIFLLAENSGNCFRRFARARWSSASPRSREEIEQTWRSIARIGSQRSVPW